MSGSHVTRDLLRQQEEIREDLRSAPRVGRTCFCELHQICCSKRFNNVPVMETYK